MRGETAVPFIRGSMMANSLNVKGVESSFTTLPALAPDGATVC